MCRSEHRYQFSSEDLFLPFCGKLSGDNRLIKFADLIPWDGLVDDYAAQFCKVPGVAARAASKSVNVAFGEPGTIGFRRRFSPLPIPETSSAAADMSAPEGLFSFLKAIPDGRYRRGVLYLQWFLLFVAVLEILSRCRSSSNLEAFARRHREVLNKALGLNFKRWPSEATFLYLFNKPHLQEFGQVLQA